MVFRRFIMLVLVLTAAHAAFDAAADSASRLTQVDSRFHIAALQLSDHETAFAQTVFDGYLTGVADVEQALMDFVTWSGRWSKEHRYWMQLREWQKRIVPESWRNRPDLERAYYMLRDRYFASLQDAFPGSAARVALLERSAVRTEWLHSGHFLHEFPELIRTLGSVAPDQLDSPLVQDAISQYETRMEPIVRFRQRLQVTYFADAVRAKENKDFDELTRMNAVIPLSDYDIWVATNAMLDVFVAALPEREAGLFYDSVLAALYPTPPLASRIDALLERAESETLTDDERTRIEEIRSWVSAERDRVRSKLREVFDEGFDKKRIKSIARTQAASTLGLSTEPTPTFGPGYEEIAKSFVARANELALEVHEILEGQLK